MKKATAVESKFVDVGPPTCTQFVHKINELSSLEQELEAKGCLVHNSEPQTIAGIVAE